MEKLKQNIKTAKIAILGYPGDYYERLSLDKLGTSQWGVAEEGKIKEIREQKESILHYIATLSGQSGAPILLIEEKAIAVVGIHKGVMNVHGVPDSNSGRLITPKLIETLLQ